MTQWAPVRERDRFAYLSTVGMAGLVFLGGMLNLTRLAYPIALDMLFLAGLLFAALRYSVQIKEWLARRPVDRLSMPRRSMKIPGYILPGAILAVAVIFYALSLLPAAVFNISDDFHTYVPRPFRMLQTGTLAGNPFELLGIDSLGAHAFLQAFALLELPAGYLLGVDAVFGFALTGLLLLAIGRKFNLHWSFAAVAILAFIAINPQSVNISTLYISSAVILGLIFASCLLLERLEQSADQGIPKMEAGLLGLLLAALVALKITFVGYACIYGAIFFGGLLLVRHDRLAIVKICSVVVGVAILALLPWLGLHAPYYLLAMKSVLHAPTVSPSNGYPMFEGNIADLFSAADLSYGGSLLSYGIIVLLLAVAGAYALWLALRSHAVPLRRGYFLIVGTSCAAGTIGYLFNGLVFPSAMAVRYSCPVLIATFPCAVLMLSMAISDTPRKARLLHLPDVKAIVIWAAALLVVISFWNNFLVRAGRAYDQHMILSFPVNDYYNEYNRYAISAQAQDAVRAIQYKTLPGQKILAWISMPMNLDFARNEIYSVMGPGLLNPWIGMPLNGNVDDVVHYLKGEGVRYIMWEYDGYGITSEERFQDMLSHPFAIDRKIGERGLYLRHILAAIMAGGKFLYYSDGMILFDLQQVNSWGQNK